MPTGTPKVRDEATSCDTAQRRSLATSRTLNFRRRHAMLVGLGKATPQMIPSTLNITKIDPFNADEPLQNLYDEAIKAAQDGRADNLLKRMRFFVLAQAAVQACQRFPRLDFVECGCFNGH